MKAAGISGDIGLISTLDSVAVGNSSIVVLAFARATVANSSRRGDALGCARGERWRESGTNHDNQPRVRESDCLDLDDNAVGQRDHRDPGRGDEYRRARARGTGWLRRNPS